MLQGQKVLKCSVPVSSCEYCWTGFRSYCWTGFRSKYSRKGPQRVEYFPIELIKLFLYNSFCVVILVIQININVWMSNGHPGFDIKSIYFLCWVLLIVVVVWSINISSLNQYFVWALNISCHSKYEPHFILMLLLRRLMFTFRFSISWQVQQHLFLPTSCRGTLSLNW